MKIRFLLAALLISFQGASGQQAPLSAYAGEYGVRDSTLFSIILRDNHLFFSTPHDAKIGLLPIPGHRFQLEHVQPEAFIDFIPDSLGRIVGLIIHQKGKFTWIKVPEDKKDSLPEKKQDALADFTGKYRQDIDLYNFVYIREEGGQLKTESLILSPLDANRFTVKDATQQRIYEFIKDSRGRVQKLVMINDGPRNFLKRPSGSEGNGVTSPGEHVSSRKNGFTRADSLRGMLTPIRTCYDVLFYDLNATVDPDTKSVHGNTVIRFRTVAPSDSIQVDLYANMKIEKILFHDRELSYSRECNAVYIRFPAPLTTGNTEEINIFYSGQPQIPDLSILAGGFIWGSNREGKIWIESVCQGAGASLWWPCKDHLSDKPDSMKISITVPRGLTDISNGRLQQKTDLPGNLTRFDWYVSYPINNYNVVVNIGDYAHFSDSYIRQRDTMTLDYYCMPYNMEKAKKIFEHVKPMLALYEKDFGEYPFRRDGFTLMESLYPMEHQGAISIGSIDAPFNSDKWDPADLLRATWHESAHEWWGNSVTCKDMADFWIHEAFATYAEALAYEYFSGKKAMLKYLKAQHPENKEPIIGVYDVNNFHEGDMYPKGCLMLNTLRNVIDNDSLWFSILRGIQEHFRYQPVTTEDIVEYVNLATQKDYTPFFDQYLRHPAIPELALAIKRVGASLVVQYKWNADVRSFNMPVKATTAKNTFTFIHPTADWQTLSLQNMRPADFKVDTDDFYIH